jgi:hypothetical protein
MATLYRVEWEDKYWGFALLTKEPFEEYEKLIKSLKPAEGVKIEDLPQARQDWLRAT